MRLLIAKLAASSVQSVSVAMNAEHDLADLATDLEGCVRLLRSGEYDLVLLLVSEGQLRARDAIARLRREAGRVPMIVLTEAGQQDADSVRSVFGGGAIAAMGQDTLHGASMAAGIDPPWEWEPSPAIHDAGSYAAMPAATLYEELKVRLDPVAETLEIEGGRVSLSQAEYRIFARLWERRGRIVTAEELMGALYGRGDRPASRVLPVFLFKLRRKLGSLGVGDIIETAVGRGFTIRADHHHRAAPADHPG